MSDQPPFRPIGYWLKLLDHLIAEDLDATLRPFELTRRHWQIMNLLHHGPTTLATIQSELGAALADGQAEMVVQQMEIAGLVRRSPPASFALADEGIRRFDEATYAIKEARQRLSEGLERSDYEITIRTLEAMCRNLGWGPGSP